MVRGSCLPVYLAFCGSLLVACGNVERPELDEFGCAITYGSIDSSSAHDAVVYLSLGWYGGCSGTLITNNVVLTAAHCMEGMSPSSVDVGFGVYDYSMTWRSVSAIDVHDNFDPDYLVADIALIRLSSSAASLADPISALPMSLRLESDDIGMPIEFVGFGVTQSGSGSGTRRTVTGDLDWICMSPGGCDFGSPKIAAPYTICTDQLPGGPCSGDSGGPAFVVRSGHEYVAGVTSYGINDSCTVFGCSTKVDHYEPFILDFIGGVNGASCSSASQCDSGICVDDVCCATSCTGLCMACNVPGSLGQCSPAPDGTACADSDPCDGTETCQGGSCVAGTPPSCDDHEPCTTDSCSPASGCVHTPLANGVSCSDDDVCNGEETCQGGECQAQGGLNCDDANKCTTDTCHPTLGCQHATVADGNQCFDNDVCNGAEICQGGICQTGTPIQCPDDGNSCTAEVCDPVTGCGAHDPLPDDTPCDDHNACTSGDHCQGGLCRQGTQVDCNDLNPCTADNCLAGSGCQHQPVADGTNCGGGLCGQAACQGGVCVGGGEVDCDDGDPCTYDGCDPVQGCVHSAAPDGTACDDGNVCTGADFCRGGGCTGGQSISCDDRNPCTHDHCTAGGCQHDPEVDGTNCGGGVCGTASCQAGECVMDSPATCEDYEPCTRDWCDPQEGCQHTAEPDGYACAECMACWEGVCTVLADCDDGGGCGCGTGPEGPAAGALLGLLVVALAGLRRSRA